MQPSPLLQEAADCFKEARGNVWEGMMKLHAIYAGNLWESKYDSFKEFVLDACDIKYAFAMRLVGNWNRYVVEGGIEPLQLKGIDADKLSIAARLPLTPAEQLKKAIGLSREQLQDEVNDPDDLCQHPSESRVTICGKCSKRVN